MTLIRRSFDHTIVQLNHKIIAHQMIQDPLTVSHLQREKRMFDAKLNTQRENCIFLTLYHFFHGSNTIFKPTIGCRSFQTCITVLKVHLFTCVFQHMFQGLLIVRSVCRRTCLWSRLSAPSMCVTSPCGALIGPPTAFRRNGTSVPWVSLPGPTGVMTHPG